MVAWRYWKQHANANASKAFNESKRQQRICLSTHPPTVLIQIRIFSLYLVHTYATSAFLFFSSFLFHIHGIRWWDIGLRSPPVEVKHTALDCAVNVSGKRPWKGAWGQRTKKRKKKRKKENNMNRESRKRDNRSKKKKRKPGN